MSKPTLSKTLMICTIAIITIGQNTFAQGPDTLWTRTYGGSSDDIGFSVQQTTDGGYIITGSTQSYGVNYYMDVWLIKTDTNGDTTWSRTFGSVFGALSEGGNSVQQTSDGGYIITGNIETGSIGYASLYLIKTDVNGDTSWTQTFGESDHSDYGNGVQQTSDGGYIIAGETNSYGAGSSDFYLVKTDDNGDTLWTRTYGGNSYDTGYSVDQTNDGGYIITGSTRSYGVGNSDIWIVKTDSIGDTTWTHTYGDIYTDVGNCVRQTSDGGYIIAGTSTNKAILLKIDATGNTLWTREYNFESNSQSGAKSVQQTPDGGYIFTGNTYSFSTQESDLTIIRTDADGDTLWTQTYGGNSYETGYSVDLTDDGGYIITGYTQSYGAGGRDVYLIRLAPEEAPELSISPDSLDFNDMIVGETATEQLTIKNTGIIDLNVSSITISGIDSLNFSLATAGSFTLAPGDSLFLDICFTPDDTGSFSASIDFESDGGDESVALTGKGFEIAGDYALEFDGVDDLVNLPSGVDISSGNFTIAAWFKSTNTSESKYIISSANSTDNDPIIEIYTKNTVAGEFCGFARDNIGGGPGSVCTGVDDGASDGDWHHGVFTRNGNLYTIYLDGVIIVPET